MKGNLQLIVKAGILISIITLGFYTSKAATADATRTLYPTSFTNNTAVVYPEYALRGSGDGTIASFDNIDDRVTYLNFDIPSMPSAFTIKGIAVYLMGGTSATRELKVDLTWDGGINFSPSSYLTYFANYDLANGYYEIGTGGSEDLWGRTAWTSDELSNANFGVRLTANDGEGEVELDEIYIRVFYVVPEGFCNGSAVFAEGIFFVSNSQNAAGEPDGNVAVLPPNDRLEMDLTGGSGLYIPANTNLKVLWAKTNEADNDVTVNVYRIKSYFDPENYIGTYTISSSTLTEQLIPITFDARYLVFQYNSSSLSIDAVTYSCPCEPPAITLGIAEPACNNAPDIWIPYTSITNCDEESRLIIDWEDEGFTDMDALLWDYSDWPDETGNLYVNLPENLSPGTYYGSIKLQTGDCTSEIYPFSITVELPPTAPVATNSGPVCIGSSFTLSATGDLEYYLWYGFNGVTYGYFFEYGSTLTINTDDTWEPGDYTYQVYQIKSCWSEAGTTKVTVSKMPDAGAFENESQSICEGTSDLVRFATGADPNGEWLSSNPEIASVDENGKVTGISEGDAVITYKVTGEGGCTGQTDEASITITVAPLKASILGNNGALCGEGTAEFYLKGTPGAVVQYSINNSGYGGTGNTFDSDGNLTISVSNASTDQTLRLVALTSGEWCYRELDGESTVEVFLIPEDLVISSAQSIIEGSSVVLTASGADSYSWSSLPAGFSSTDAVVTVSPSKNTTYTVTGTTNGCSSSDEVIVYVRETCKNSADQYEPNNLMSDNLFSIPLNIEIGANLLNSKDPDWYKLDISTLAKYTLNLTKSGSVNPTIGVYGSNGRRLKSIDRMQPNSYNLPVGTYYIKVNAGVKSYLCYTLKVVEDGSAVGAIASYDDTKSAEIDQIPDEFCKIWPNPASDRFSFLNGMSFPVQVMITDYTGRTVELVERININETYSFGENYAPGLYILEAKGGGTEKIFKIVKQ